MVFITAVCLILFNTYNFRSLRESIFKIGIATIRSDGEF